ncbi:MAG: hypothetical protein KAS23_07995, partial [Anaerohalosphaera sp.]|nr:hypothetical protein [Anaerohalosphaera sp.]
MSKQYAVPSKVSTVCFLACLFITGVQAADFTITAFDQANPKPSVGHQVVTTVDFPDGTDTYSSVVMVLENFNLDSPLDQDEWDRIASINIINDDGSEFQVARWITPYWNVSHIWTLDVTDLQHLFRGSKRMKLRIVGYASADGNTASVSFEFTLGTPPYYPVRIRGIWPDNGSITSVEFGKASGGWYYLNSETTNFFTDVTMSTLASADQFKSRVIVTGHGFGNTSYNAAEFMPQWQDITVGSRTWGNELWNECSTNPTGSQCAYGPDDDPDCSGSSCCGTWYYDRAGWCPGSVPVPWTVDVSSEVTPGQDVTFDYDHWRYNAGAKLVYTNAGSSSANLSVTSQFIEFVQTNKTIIEPFEDIVINGLDRTTFSGISRRYYFRNFSGSSINWTASDNVDWITTSPSSGTLASGETAAVDVTLNANADQLGVGNHAAALAFADTTNNLSENRQVDLTIVQSEMTAHWNFDETSGTTAADSTGNGFDGTVSGAVWTTGHDGGALDFTASNSD